MGGAVVAVAGVAAGLAHGVVRGAAAGSNIPQLALPSTNDDQASTVYLSVDGSSEVPSAPAGRLLDGSGEERPKVPTTGRRPPQSHACWNPQLGNLRPLQHLYSGDCKLTRPTPTAAAFTTTTAAAASIAAAAASATANAATANAAATIAAASIAADAAVVAAEARTVAAVATRLPESQGSLHGSVIRKPKICNWLECKKVYRLWASRLVSDLPTGSVGRVSPRERVSLRMHHSYGYFRPFSQYCSRNQV